MQAKVILYAVAVAFFLTQRYKWHLRFKLNRKPFNCMGCMTGWVSMGLSYNMGWQIPLIGLVGVMVGSIIENAYLRYL